MSTNGAEMLVTADWLLSHLEDQDLRILDMRNPMKYMSGHIPGSVLVPYERVVDSSPSRPYLNVASKDEIEGLLSDSGVNNESLIVVYGDLGGSAAARLFWTLELYGANVKILNIPFVAWMSRGLPVTREIIRPEPSKFVAKKGTDLRISSEQIHAKISNTNMIIVDTRSQEEYGGTVESDHKPGRIPGSINIPWNEAVGGMDLIFKNKDNLEKVFESRGVTRDKEVVCYCHVGERSSHTFLALRVLGYPKVKIYDRSFAEWSSKLELPIEV